MLKDAAIVPYIPVADVARARKFYEGTLGLVPKEEYAGGVIYECGSGSWVFMYRSPGAGTSRASTAFWTVNDVAAEVAALKARGVVFEEYDLPGITTVDGIAEIEGNYPSKGTGERAVWFRDSEGNLLGIGQPF